MKTTSILFLPILFLSVVVQSCYAQTTQPATTQTPVVSTETPAQMVSGSNKGGDYQLVKREGDVGWHPDGRYGSLCLELEKSLNSFPNEPPMVCERKFNAELGFTTPDWQPIEAKDIHWEHLRQVHDATLKTRYPSVSLEALEKEWKDYKAILDDLGKKYVILWSATFDIDNKRGDEQVFRLYSGVCALDYGVYQNQATPIMFVVGGNGEVDLSYKRLFHKYADIFFFKKHTYLSSWWGNPLMKDAHLNIDDAFKPLDTFGFSNKPICLFKYTAK